MNFSNNLQFLRKKEGLSQEQLAEELNVTRQSVSKWESNQSYPEMDKLIAISKLFNCTIEQLVNGNVTQKIEPLDEEKFFNKAFQKIYKVIDDIAKMLSKKDFKGIIRFIVELAIIVLIIWILKLPFMLLQDIIHNMLNSFDKVGYYISQVFYYIIEIAYIIASFIFFIYAFKTRFLDKEESEVKNDNLKKGEEVKPNLEKKEEEVKEEPIKQNVKVKKDYTLVSIFTAIIVFILKIFAFFLLGFVVMGVVFFAGCLAATIVLLLQGVGIFGLVLGAIGCLTFVLLISEILFSFIFNKKNSLKRLFITFCISLLMIGSAVALTALDFTRFTIVNGFPKEYELISTTKELRINKDTRLSNKVIYEDIQYVVDNNLKNTVKVEINYHKNCRNDEIILEDNQIIVDWNNDTMKVSDMTTAFINGLKDKKVYDFGNLYDFNIKIYGNAKNIDQLKKYQTVDKEKDIEDNYEKQLNDMELSYNKDHQEYIATIEKQNEDIENLNTKNEDLKEKYDSVTQKYNELLERVKSLSE